MPLNNFVRLSCLGLTVYKLMRCLKAMPHDFLIALAFQRGVRLTFVCRLSALWLTDSFHAEAPLDGELKEGGGWGWWWGWGTLNKVLYGEFLPPVQPLTILYTISDRKGTPFVYGRNDLHQRPPILFLADSLFIGASLNLSPTATSLQQQLSSV